MPGLRQCRRWLVSAATAAILFAVPFPPAMAEECRHIKIALTRAMGSGPLLLTDYRGYFSTQGLKPELVFVEDDEAVRQAVASHEATFGATALTSSVLANAPRHFKIIASEYSDHAGFPSTAMLIRKAAYHAGFKNVADLAGKRIGVDASRSSESYALARIAERFAFPDNMKLIPLATPASEVAALRKGDVDAVVVPYHDTLEAPLPDMIIVPVASLAETQSGVIIADDDAINHDRRTIDAFVRAYQQGVDNYSLTFLQRSDGDDVFKPADYSEILEMIAKRAQIVASSLDKAPPYVDRLGRPDGGDVAAELRYWQKRGKVPPNTKLTDVLDATYTAEHVPLSLQARGSVTGTAQRGLSH